MQRYRSSGNVLIYVLIAIALFAALSFSLTKQLGRTGGTSTLDNQKADLRAEELINYATAARSAIEQMRVMGNVLPTEFNFVKPGDANYDTGANAGKVYHAGGGGLNVFAPSAELFASDASKRGWASQQGTNVAWTASSASDILFTFVDLDQRICSAINKRLYKNAAIPDMTLTSSAAFINGGADDADFTVASCSDCNQKVSMCVKDANGAFAYYSILLGR